MNRGVGVDLLGDGATKEAILMVYAKIPKIAMIGVVEKRRSDTGTGLSWIQPRVTLGQTKR